MRTAAIQWIRYILLTMSVTVYCLSSADANCVRKSNVDVGCDPCGVGIGLGAVNLTSAYLQPVGTPLGRTVFSITSAKRYSSPDLVLYECDISDINSMYEVFATNGDDRVGGYHELGTRDGYRGYYATYFPYVGLKLTHLNSGKEFSRYWQKYPITSYVTTGNKIQIRVKDFSAISAELIRISTLPEKGKSNYCGSPSSSDLTNGMASTVNPSSYTCEQPNGYVMFEGPGIKAEQAGTDSATNIGTWGTGRWIAMGMGTAPASTLTYTATCVARNVTPLVVFPKVSATLLNKGGAVSSQFNIIIECDNAAVSGVAQGRTILGLQVPYNNYITAQRLGLVNYASGVKYLLSDNYGLDSSLATGVGISLNNTTTGAAMNFLGWSSCSSNAVCPNGEIAGWYPILNGTTLVGSNAAGYLTFTSTLTATLQALPGKTATAGRVSAQAYIWVRVQ